MPAMALPFNASSRARDAAAIIGAKSNIDQHGAYVVPTGQFLLLINVAMHYDST